MKLEKLARWAVPGALLMGGAWFASGIVAFVMAGGQGLGDIGETRFYLIEGLHGLGEIGLLAALAGLHVLHAQTYRRLGIIGFWAAFIGTAFLVAATLVGITVVAIAGDVNLLFGLLFAAGLLGWMVGFSLIGVAILRSNVLPNWVALLLVTFFPVIIIAFLALDAYGAGGIIVGLMWGAIGYRLWTHEQATTRVGLEEAGPQTAGG